MECHRPADPRCYNRGMSNIPASSNPFPSPAAPQRSSRETHNAEAALLSGASFADHQQVLRHRWQEALDTCGFDLAVIPAGTNRNYAFDDQAPPFRPNPHFAQFLPGLAAEGSELIVRPGEAPVLLFYQPADFWHLPPSHPEWAAQHMQIEAVDSKAALEAARDRYLTGSNAVAAISPAPSGEALEPAQHNPAALLHRLDFVRGTKTPFEIAAVQAATARAVAGHLAAAEAFRGGASEYHIYMAFLAATGNTGASLPYSSIVALNEHCGVLHYQHYDALPPDAHRSFLIDAGASALGYASDITRTLSGAAAPATFVDLVTALDQAQQALIAGIAPGVAYAELHGAMLERIAALLCDAGILQCGLEQALEQQLADPFMPHGLGHLIGLQTHDVGGHLANPEGELSPPDERFPALRLTRTMASGALFTIEPGIYFIPLLLEPLRSGPDSALFDWPLIDELLPCGGIRIEDNVLITEDGPRNLTREAFAAASNG